MKEAYDRCDYFHLNPLGDVDKMCHLPLSSTLLSCCACVSLHQDNKYTNIIIRMANLLQYYANRYTLSFQTRLIREKTESSDAKNTRIVIMFQLSLIYLYLQAANRETS